jgi:hypothetical protein
MGTVCCCDTTYRKVKVIASRNGKKKGKTIGVTLLEDKMEEKLKKAQSQKERKLKRKQLLLKSYDSARGGKFKKHYQSSPMNKEEFLNSEEEEAKKEGKLLDFTENEINYTELLGKTIVQQVEKEHKKQLKKQKSKKCQPVKKNRLTHKDLTFSVEQT